MSSSEEFESADEGDEVQKTVVGSGRSSPKPSETSTSKFAVDESNISCAQKSETADAINWEPWDDDWGTKPEELTIATSQAECCHAKETTSSSTVEKSNIDEHMLKQLSRQRVPLRLEKKSSMSKSSGDGLKEDQVRVLEKLSNLSVAEKNKESGGWGFGSWGSSLLTCAASVTEFTSHVSQGLGVVMNTVETTLGVPSPEELIEKSREKPSLQAKDESDSKSNESIMEDSSDSNKEEAKGATSNILGSVASLTQVIESTGSKVISSGLDTLEIIGKKTMDIITEGDPGLRKKRSLFSQGQQQGNISSQENNEQSTTSEEVHDEEEEEEPSYNTYFEDEQGRVHLEALELLAHQADAKIQRLRLSKAYEVKWIQKLFVEGFVPIQQHDDSAGEENEAFDEDIDACLSSMNLEIGVSSELVKSVQSKAWENINGYKETKYKLKEAYKDAIVSLAKLTAKSVELVHKVAELILVNQNFNVCNTIDQNLNLAEVICQEISSIAMAFVNTLNGSVDTSAETYKDYITTYIFLEASTSKNIIQDAFMFLASVVQLKQLEVA